MTKDDVRAYYAVFAEREWQRLANADDGAVEFALTCAMLERYLPSAGRILDIGGGAGRYAIWLAERGYQVVLADLSPNLLELAQARIKEANAAEQVEAIVEADACDLSRWLDNSFDAVVCLGPFYHLPDSKDRERAARELVRVLRFGGTAFIALMPRLALLRRVLARPDERKNLADAAWTARLMEHGIFENTAAGKFTYAYGANTTEIEPFFRQYGLEQMRLLSAEGITDGIQKTVSEVLATESETRQEIFNLLVETADDPTILGAANHLLYIGQRI